MVMGGMKIWKDLLIVFVLIIFVDLFSWWILTKYGIKIDVKILALGIFTTAIMSGYDMLKIFDFRNEEEERKKIDKVICGFDSIEMRKGMMRLGDFKREYPSTFLEIFAEKLKNKDFEARELSLDSGAYFHHFRNNVFRRFEDVDDKFIKSVVYISQVELLLDVVDPIEKTKAKLLNTQYDENVAKECRRIFKDELKGRKKIEIRIMMGEGIMKAEY